MSKASRAAYKKLEEAPFLKYGDYEVTRDWMLAMNPLLGHGGRDVLIFNPKDPSQRFGISANTAQYNELSDYLLSKAIGGSPQAEVRYRDLGKYFPDVDPGERGTYQSLFKEIPEVEPSGKTLYERTYEETKAAQTIPASEKEQAKKEVTKTTTTTPTVIQPTTVASKRNTYLLATPLGKPAFGAGGEILYPDIAKQVGYLMGEPIAGAGVAPAAPAPAPTGFGPSSYTGVSVIDYLKSVGQPSGFSSRAKLAAQYGITGYLGTEAQNTKLLGLLRVGKGPAPTAPIAPEKPGVEPGAVVDTGEADRQAAADEANKLAQDIFAGITDEDVDVRASVKLLADLKEKIEAGLAGVGEEEKPQSLADLFQAEKVKLGIEPLETELADLDAEIDRIQTTLLVEAEEAGEKIISAREIGRAKGVLQKRADRETALLNIERSAVARTINNKLATLEIVMNLTQADVTNASAYYDRQLTRSVQLYNLIKGVEEAEETRAERATNNAQFNLTTLTNLFKAMGASYDDLSDANKQSLRRLELEAGFPVGLTESFMKVKPKAEALTTVTGYDAAGNQIITFVYADKDGMPGTIRTVVTGGRKEEKAPTAAETKEAELSTIEGSLFATRGTDGFVDPGAYQSLRTKAAIGPTEFDKRFSHMLSPAERRRLGITIGEEEGFGTASEQSKVKAWIMENDTGEAQERNLERIKTSETYFYWVLNQIEGEGGWTP